LNEIILFQELDEEPQFMQTKEMEKEMEQRAAEADILVDKLCARLEKQHTDEHSVLTKEVHEAMHQLTHLTNERQLQQISKILSLVC
jgi:hypothetical protein